MWQKMKMEMAEDGDGWQKTKKELQKMEQALRHVRETDTWTVD
jgi:hypothetical protein